MTDTEDFYQGAYQVDSGEVTLRVVERGPGDGTTVLMLHGWPDSARLWRHQVDPLADAQLRLLIPDQRGFGGSTRPSEVASYSMSNQIRDALAILDHAGVEKAHVVGHDWGSALGWVLAAHYPDRVESLTAISAGHPAAFLDAGLRQRARSWYMLLFLFEDVAERFLMEDDWARFRRFVDGHPETETWIADLSRPGALTASLNWYRANMPAEAYLQDSVSTPWVEVDVMGIWSTGDFALVEEQMSGSARYVKGAWRYERIEGSSHWVPLDAPDRLASLLIDWVESRAD